jgi:hypothetical protein
MIEFQKTTIELNFSFKICANRKQVESLNRMFMRKLQALIVEY